MALNTNNDKNERQINKASFISQNKNSKRMQTESRNNEDAIESKPG